MIQPKKGWNWAGILFMAVWGLVFILAVGNYFFEEHVEQAQEQQRQALIASLTPDQLAKFRASESRARASELAATEERAEEARRIAAAAEKKRQQLQYACNLKSICSDYGKARQDCATAGNFANCLAVKLGDDDASAAEGSCTNDGHVAGTNEPSYLDCVWPTSR